MGGLFGFFDYAKPGPGVEKNEKPKGRVKTFLSIYYRKFWYLSKLNMQFFLFNIPGFIISLILLTSVLNIQIVGGKEFVELDNTLKLMFAAFICCIPVITVGPAQAGFTYVLRNFSREEHAFVWDDFKDHASKNFKQSLSISFIDFIVTVIIILDINAINALESSIIVTIATVMLFVFIVIYMMMHMYIYPILVTFDLKTKQILKNAFILSILSFLPNLLVLGASLVLVFLTFVAINKAIGIFLLPFFLVSTIGFLTNFHAYKYIKKYMIDKMNQPEENGDVTVEEV